MTETLIKRFKDTGLFSVLSGMGAEFGDDFLKKQEEELVEDLAVEFTRLFIGPGKHISPHESVHNERNDGDWGQLWGKSTVEVKKFIETAGLEYQSDYNGLPDHISVEMEFMQEAARREAQTMTEGDNEGLLYCLKMQKIFIDDHLYTWIPDFCTKVINEAKLSFYREMAKLTKSFVEFEKDNINIYISEAEKETYCQTSS